MDKVINTINYLKTFLSGNYNITRYNSPTKETICGFDGFINMKYNSSSEISRYSVHLGDFSSYNKVLEPTNIEVVLCTKGTFEKISAVISTLNNYKNSTELVDIQTPYGVYIGYNIVNVDYELSTDKGYGYVECTITAQQIEVSAAQFTAIRNIEEKPTALLGKMSLLQSTIHKYEKITGTVTKAFLGTELIFSNHIKLI